MQPVAVEAISSNAKKHHTFTKLLAIQAYQIFKEGMKKEDMGIESSCAKTKIMIETLTENFLTVAALTETEFAYQDDSDQCSIFGWLGSSGLPCKELNVLFGNQVKFYEYKKVDSNSKGRHAARSFEEQNIRCLREIENFATLMLIFPM